MNEEFAMISLDWQQVHAWRLAQHRLTERAGGTQWLDVVRAKRNRSTVSVELFALPTAEVKDGVEAEAARLGAYLDAKAEVEYA
jgi:hypothetical protein